MSSDGVNQGRRRFLTVATSVVGAAGVVGAAVPFVGSWAPSAKARAAGAPVRVNLSKLEPGGFTVEEWRGKPVYIVRRTPEALASLEKLNDIVADPESERPQQPGYVLKSNPHLRAIKPEYAIMLGVCTHLGCAPQYRPDVAPADLGPEWVGGFFCPCHGSKFDLSGRVYKGVPAPSNLEVPPHRYVDDSLVVVIGEDQEAV